MNNDRISLTKRTFMSAPVKAMLITSVFVNKDFFNNDSCSSDRFFILRNL